MFVLNTTIDDSSPLISYEPVEGWNSYGPVSSGVNNTGYYKNSFTSTWTQNAFATLQFNGSSIFIYGGRRKTYGDFTVALDGINTTLSSYSPNVQDPPGLLFSTDVQQGWHTLVISNDGTNGLDIDSICWTSGTSTSSNNPSSPDTSPPSTTYNGDMSEFSWEPKDAWPRDTEGASGRTTSSIGASVNFTFEVRELSLMPTMKMLCLHVVSLCQAVSLSGPIGLNYTSLYSVVLDNSTPRSFNSVNRIGGTAVLFHADNLGPGNHTVIIINHGVGDTAAQLGTNIRRQATHSNSSLDTPNRFGINEAQVWKGESTAIIPHATDNIQPEHSTLTTGAIVGISLGFVALVALVALLCVLNRHNKTLWARLQKGYMIQSQFDPSLVAPTPSSTPLMRSKGISLPPVSSNMIVEPFMVVEGNHGSGFSQSSVKPTHKRDQTGNSLYNPYVGFGQSRSERHVASGSIGLSASGNGDYGRQQGRFIPEPLVLPIPKSGSHVSLTPHRSETMLSVSTLVAEDGREPLTGDLDTAVDSKPLFEGWKTGRHVAQNASRTTPTPSSYAAEHPEAGPVDAMAEFPPIKTSRTTPTSKSSSILVSETRRSSRMSRCSRDSWQRRHQNRSSSPSRVRLLHPSRLGESAQHADLENEYDNEVVESAEFYALDVVQRLRLSTMSLVRSQSDAQTPVRGRMEDELDYNSDFPRVQIPSWLTGSGNMSTPITLSPVPMRSDLVSLDPPSNVERYPSTLIHE
ncbi:hypothetical protein J3R30DRAFT_3767175 [Lentinula aciculospora]|uniref:Transmembrane protein n=1 Tax=Lentinula aciculospora TaxID=153920 RepID=A0A9W8ZQW6_9AGAR|nr:hypothetical protein J3R30DRAFT_3767175 [Lentinula aciculospora]